MVMCLPCNAALGFTGLSFLEGPLKDCTKCPKPNKEIWLPARVCSSGLFVLRSRPCSPEGGVKTPAVKPCIVYIIVLLCQNMSDKMPDGMPDRLSECMSYRMSVDGDH